MAFVSSFPDKPRDIIKGFFGFGNKKPDAAPVSLKANPAVSANPPAVAETNAIPDEKTKITKTTGGYTEEHAKLVSEMTAGGRDWADPRDKSITPGNQVIQPLTTPAETPQEPTYQVGGWDTDKATPPTVSGKPTEKTPETTKVASYQPIEKWDNEMNSAVAPALSQTAEAPKPNTSPRLVNFGTSSEPVMPKSGQPESSNVIPFPKSTETPTEKPAA